METPDFFWNRTDDDQQSDLAVHTQKISLISNSVLQCGAFDGGGKLPRRIRMGTARRSPLDVRRRGALLYVRRKKKIQNVEGPVAEKQRDIANQYKVYIRECR